MPILRPTLYLGCEASARSPPVVSRFWFCLYSDSFRRAWMLDAGFWLFDASFLLLDGVFWVSLTGVLWYSWRRSDGLPRHIGRDAR